jgi:hypothetical protein
MKRISCAGCDAVFRFRSYERLARRVREHVARVHPVVTTVTVGGGVR